MTRISSLRWNSSSKRSSSIFWATKRRESGARRRERGLVALLKMSRIPTEALVPPGLLQGFRQVLHDLAKHVVGLDALGLALEVEEHAVPERGQRYHAHVVDRGGEAALEQGADLGGEQQRLGAARRRAELHEALDHVEAVPLGGVRRLEETNRVVLHVVRDRDLADKVLHLEDLPLVDDGADRRHGHPGRALQDAVELVPVGEADVELEEEAIELRFGQGVGALAL